MSSETKTHPFRILARSGWWFALSWLLILSSVGKMVVNKQTTGQSLSFGIDFNGGAAYVYKFDERPGNSAAEVIGNVRAVLVDLGIERPKIQEFAGHEVQIRTLTGSSAESVPTAANDAKAEAERILQALRDRLGEVELVGSELVGPVIGEHLRKQGSLALLVGCLMILGYISVRYNIGGLGGGLTFGLAAVVALIHDVMVMVSVYAWTMTEVNTGFVAAVLTVVGYSVNDTVIIFDRIRENLRALDAPQRRNMQQVESAMEASLWQTMGRSIVTLVTTLFPLLTLVLFGGVTIRDFAFALLVGIVSGGYSSIFQATPVVMWTNRRHLRKTQEAAGRAPQRPRRAERRRPTKAARPAPAETAETPQSAAETAPDAAPQPTESETQEQSQAAASRDAGKSRSRRSGQRRRGKRKRRH